MGLSQQRQWVTADRWGKGAKESKAGWGRGMQAAFTLSTCTHPHLAAQPAPLQQVECGLGCRAQVLLFKAAPVRLSFRGRLRLGRKRSNSPAAGRRAAAAGGSSPQPLLPGCRRHCSVMMLLRCCRGYPCCRWWQWLDGWRAGQRSGRLHGRRAPIPRQFCAH